MYTVSETGEILEKYGSRLLAISSSGKIRRINRFIIYSSLDVKDHNNPSLTDLVDWLAPLKALTNVPETGPIPILIKQLRT